MVLDRDMLVMKGLKANHLSSVSIRLFLLVFWIMVGGAHAARAATWSYDFGTTTGTWTTGTSISFLPSPPSGTSFVRVGTGGGSVALENPGSASLGTGTELVLTAPTSTSVNKFSVFDYAGSNFYSLSFSTIISGNSGIFSFFTGNGASFSNANAFTGSESAASLRFGLGASTISGSYRSVSTWTALSSLPVSKDSVMDFAIYGNNDASSTTYFRGGATYTLPTGTWDLWLGNTLSGTNLSKAQLATGPVDSFMVYGESSTGNAGTLRLDNLVYGNELPAAPPAGNYWAPAVGGGGSGTWTPAGVVWATTSGTIGTGTQSAAGALVFGNSAGTITVSGSVSAPAGLTISTDGYQFTSGTIVLTGANAGTNTITTGSGVTATVNSLVAGSAGFTKAGLGTLLLGSSNSIFGTIAVSAGTLKAGSANSFGSSSVTLSAGATLDLNNLSFANTITNNGGTIANAGSFSGTSTVSGTVDYAGAVGGTVVVDAGGVANFSGSIDSLTVSAGGQANLNDGASLSQPVLTNDGLVAVNQSGSSTLATAITGAGAFQKLGSGILTVSGNNTYSGATTVSAGGLKVTGSIGGGGLSVAASAWLMGTGTIGGPVTVSGTLAPGSSPGVITLGSLVLTPTSSTAIDIASAGPRGTAYDGISILDAGGLTYGGTMTLAFGGAAIADNTTFDIVAFTGPSSGSLAAVESTGFYAGTWTDNSNGTFTLVKDAQTLTFSQSTGDIILVPEPSAIALAAAGVGTLAAALLRRRHA